MSAPIHDRPSSAYRRAILIYLVAIVGPTLVLLYLGLQSVQRQRQAIATLRATNLRLSEEKLADEVSRRSDQLAGTCLRDPELTALGLLAAGPTDRPSAGQIGAVFRRVKRRHPIADLFFILQGNGIRYPSLHTPPPRQLDEYLAQEDSSSREAYAAQFAEAETLEIRQQRPDLALAVYRRCSEQPVSANLKALAFSRMARCAQKSNQPRLAEQIYQTLYDRYSEVWDPFHRPYALIAGLELEALTQARPVAGSPRLVQLARDLTAGRWDLSAEELEYFRARLSEHLRGPLLIETDYLRQFELAAAVQEAFRVQTPLRVGDMYPYALGRGGRDYQTYYTLAAGPPGSDTIVGFAVDLKWIEQHLLPETAADLGMRERAVVSKVSATTSDTGPRSRVAFAPRFPFWELSLVPATPGLDWLRPRRDVLVFAGSTLLVLSTLLLGVLLLMRDVSRQLAVGRLRADFVSAVSHELKTPLTLIRLYAEMLSEGQACNQEEQQTYSRIITHQSERLTHLIDRVLDFARIDRRQKQYYLAQGDLGAVIARAVDGYRQYLARRGFAVVTDLESPLPPVRFDPDAVSQAVLNLLDNAAKYSIDAKFVAVRLHAVNAEAIFEVEDHGIGISMDERDKIFQQFYRSRGSAGQGGYGLGLFLVKHIMDAHGGSVEVESEVGRGTLFRLIFPAASGATPVERAAAS